MKKQKLMKMTAFVSVPTLENAFSAPVTHNGEISVVFAGKNMKIHGWNGAVWSEIYAWNNLDKQWTFENTFESYFLESLTGQEESVNVSFFSTDRYQGSTPELAGITREVKLYDVDEVPIYTSSDNGKMLTIMSDGSLRWLAAGDSFVIDGGSSEEPSGATYSWLEDSANLMLENETGTIISNGTLSNGVLSTLAESKSSFHVNGVPHFELGNYVSAGTNAASYSIWFKKTGDTFNGTTRDNTMFAVMAHQSQTKGLAIRVRNSNQVQLGGAFSYPSRYAAVAGNLSSNIGDGNWHHVAVSILVNGDGNTEVHSMIDGVAGSVITKSGTYDLGPTETHPWNVIGATNKPVHSTGEFDAIELVGGTSLTEAQMLALYNAGQGGMSIEEAAAL